MAAAGTEGLGKARQQLAHRPPSRERERGRVGGTADPIPLTGAWCQIQDSQLQKICHAKFRVCSC